LRIASFWLSKTQQKKLKTGGQPKGKAVIKAAVVTKEEAIKDKKGEI